MKRLLLAGMIGLTGCAGLTQGWRSSPIEQQVYVPPPSQDTNQLRPGMTQDEVKLIMGEPGISQYKDNRLYWRYVLNNNFAGRFSGKVKPFYVVFSDGKLVEFSVDTEEMRYQQKRWDAQNPPTEEKQIDLTIKDERKRSTR